MASNETVTVASKLPHGLILRVFEMCRAADPLPDGTVRMVERAQPIPETFTINGAASPEGKELKCGTAAGFALTPGVPKELWDRWLEQNKDSDFVVNELVFASDKGNSVSAQARANEKRKTGLERLDPDNLPRVGRLKVESADKRATA